MVSLSYGQQIVRTMGLPLKTDYINFDLDSTASCTVYVMHRTLGSLNVDPDTSTAQNPPELQYVTGDLTLGIMPDSVTREESDSLTAYIKPLMAFNQDSTVKIIEKDSTFLVFDTKGTYTATSADYLDWTHHRAYFCNLTGEIWATQGFCIIFNQYASDVATAYTRVYVTITRD